MFQMDPRADYSFMVANVVKGQWDSGKRKQNIQTVADQDGRPVEIGLEQEPGSGGKDSAGWTVKNIAGYSTFVERPTGDKITRAEPFASQVEWGNIAVLQRPWTKEYLVELAPFGPGCKYSDQVDATSGAFNRLTAKRLEYGGW